MKIHKIYKPTDYYPDIINSFQPLFIKTQKYTKDVFQKEFPHVTPEKGNILLRFANIQEALNNPFANSYINILNTFSLKKLVNIYPIAKLRDFSSLNRFSPEELIQVLKLNNEDITFIKPFARQKGYNRMFNFSTENLLEISKYNETDKSRLMDLYSTRLNSKIVRTLVKDTSLETQDFAGAIQKLQNEYAKNIDNINVIKVPDNYLIRLTTKKPFKTHTFAYKAGENAIAKMTPKRFKAIEKINSEIDKINELNSLVNKHNYKVINTGNGRIKSYQFNLPPNIIRNEWEAGKLVKEDITSLFTDAAGIISDEDFRYFAKQEFKLTPFDNKSVITARKYKFTHEPLSTNSDYYPKKEAEILKEEFSKLDKVASGKKLLILDGLPGSGKSTAFKNFVKNESFYATDNDDIKACFSEYYQNGIGAQTVHTAARTVYKHKILPKALENGKNIVYQTCGDYESLNKFLQKAHKKGYTIDYVNINTDIPNSIKRAIHRQKVGGRFMDPYIILAMARRNQSAKQYMAKIISFNPYVNNSYNYNSGTLIKVEAGIETNYINYSQSKNNFVDKVKEKFLLLKKFL